ncbi:MAG TPA: shikimate kinase [Polyangia bacterium]|jgi:shikimate kinase|nr:shikimate kinase [Polyangia bacterium]
MADFAQDPLGDAPIFLIGFMGTGKSTVGRMLAAEIGFAFTDLDDVIARAAGHSVAQIFASEGEPGFRAREEQAVRAAAALRRTVIATGGGAACREANLAAMLAAGRVVALSASPAEVIRRVGTGPGRPLLHGKADPEGVAAALLAEREPFYARAHHRVDTVGKPPGVVAREIVAGLRRLRARAAGETGGQA